MRKATNILLASALLIASTAFGRAYRYRVYLKDKSKTEFSLSSPEKFLSEKSLLRRQKQGLKVDYTDLPVCSAYIKDIENAGFQVKVTSRWNNTMLVETEDTLGLTTILKQKPYVKSFYNIWTEPLESPELPSKPTRLAEIKYDKSNKEYTDYYGVSGRNIDLMHARQLHESGYKGQGMTIAIIDAGFFNADAYKWFKQTKIVGTRDFLHPSADIYAAHSHGMCVLSLIGANIPNWLVGTAPEASYWLLRSEDSETETRAEEDYWSAALEFADSVGVDMVNSSLGYSEFDSIAQNYRYRDLNGEAAMISHTASMAASKGMIVCVSAGNSGDDQWHKITVPADASDILTVGAVDSTGKNAPFSSLGYTADGRVKPDVMALGKKVPVIEIDGNIRRGNGTSFASPILCGAAACLWQEFPTLTAFQIMDVIRQSSSRYDYPDNIYGYGIPDFRKAEELAKQLAK